MHNYNCIIVSNLALADGGGVFSSTLNTCLVARNTAGRSGGGVWANGGALRNCTVTANSAPSAGGTYGGILYNSIVYYNTTYNGTMYPAPLTTVAPFPSLQARANLPALRCS